LQTVRAHGDGERGDHSRAREWRDAKEGMEFLPKIHWTD
jgi:hypothetical protein